MSDFKKGTLVVVIEHEDLETDQRARLGQQGVVVDEVGFPDVQFSDGAVLTFNPCKLREVGEYEPPEEFYFTTSTPGVVYHAKQEAGDYEVSWSRNGERSSSFWSYNAVRALTKPGAYWTIVEAPAPPEPTLDERIADAVVAVVDATRARKDQSSRAHTAQQAVDLERRALEKARNAQEDAERELSKLLDLKAQQP